MTPRYQRIVSRLQRSLTTEDTLRRTKQRALLLCGVAVPLAAYTTLVGSIGGDFSQQFTRGLSFFLAVMLILTALATFVVSALSLKAARHTGERGATSILVFGEFLIVCCAIVLVFAMYGSGLALLQLSTLGFLAGTEEEQYRHLIILSMYGGTVFGIRAFWVQWRTHGLKLIKSFWYGGRAFVETAFLAYAGLWLFRDAFKLVPEHGPNNPGFIIVVSLGLALIVGSSLSLMFRHSNLQSRPSDGHSL